VDSRTTCGCGGAGPRDGPGPRGGFGGGGGLLGPGSRRSGATRDLSPCASSNRWTASATTSRSAPRVSPTRMATGPCSESSTSDLSTPAMAARALWSSSLTALSVVASAISSSRSDHLPTLRLFRPHTRWPRATSRRQDRDAEQREWYATTRLVTTPPARASPRATARGVARLPQVPSARASSRPNAIMIIWDGL
jgi:hypothetical protein